MRNLHLSSVTVVVLAMVLAVACAGRAAPVKPAQPAAAAQPALMPEPTAAPIAASAPQTGTQQFANFDPTNFDHANNLTNQWLPLKPGTRFTYDGTAVSDSGALVPHRIVVNVTDLTKTIAGVRTLVTWDQDFEQNALAESELAFYAQDKDGNIWYVGEYPEAYDNNGKVVEAPTWIQGLKGARAGIMMQAKPQPGTPPYAEGWGPAVGWTDVGQVDQTGQKTCVAAGCYDDTLVIAETSQGEPNAQQLKTYARGVGNVRVGWRGQGEKTKETLELTKVEQLSPQDLADVRAKALALEKSAYATSKDVYASTSPLVQSGPEN